MFGTYFYNESMRRMTIGFGQIFNNIQIKRKDDTGKVIQTIRVPLAYGPKEKFLVRLDQQSSLNNREFAITLPRMGFEITGMSYASSRKLSSTLQNVRLRPSDFSRLDTQFIPVPYDIDFQLSIFVKNADDGAQIIEQILPFFRPEFTTQVNLIPEMQVVVDTPIVLNGVTIEDTYEGDFDSRRALIYNLTFSVKAYLYGPITNSGIIKRAITNFVDTTTDAEPTIDRITITPSQFANGSPLFVPSGNTQLSVAIDQISANTDFGFTTDITIDPFDITQT
mgnify:CR=1 FL=1